MEKVADAPTVLLDSRKGRLILRGLVDQKEALREIVCGNVLLE